MRFIIQAICSSLNQYLQGPLGRYLFNVSTAAEQCSRFLCSSHGRCLRRHPDTDTYLHLDPQTHTIVGQGSKLRVKGDASVEEQRRMSGDFQCQCFSGYQGERCDLEDPLQQRGDGHALNAWIYLLTPLLLHLLTWAHAIDTWTRFFCLWNVWLVSALQMLLWKGPLLSWSHVGELEIEINIYKHRKLRVPWSLNKHFCLLSHVTRTTFEPAVGYCATGKSNEDLWLTDEWIHSEEVFAWVTVKTIWTGAHLVLSESLGLSVDLR